MKNSYFNPTTHRGFQPIRVLKWNVAHQLENTNPTFMTQFNALLKKHHLQPCINYDCSPEPIINVTRPDESLIPFVNRNKEITIQETFLSYVWTMCYSLMVLFEENLHKPQLNREKPGSHQIDGISLRAAVLLNKYGMSLIRKFTPWNKQVLPNPEEYSEEEKFYVERANKLYNFAVGFILCHEIAHIKLGHLDAPTGTNTDSVIDEIKADADAFEAMLQGAAGQNAKLNSGMGMLIGFCSLLLLKSEAVNHRHPDSDERIEQLMRALDLEDANPLWGLAAMAFRIWEQHYGRRFDWPKEARHYKDLFYNIFHQGKQRKQSLWNLNKSGRVGLLYPNIPDAGSGARTRFGTPTKFNIGAGR